MTYTIADDVQQNCPKHVEFNSKNKFVKLVHLVGFIIRISGFIYLPLIVLVCLHEVGCV